MPSQVYISARFPLGNRHRRPPGGGRQHQQQLVALGRNSRKIIDGQRSGEPATGGADAGRKTSSAP